MLIWFVYDFVIILPDINFEIILYMLVMIVCLISFMNVIFLKNKKRYYAIFICSMLIYLFMNNFIPSVIDSHEAARCLDNEGAWDFKQHICRTDFNEG